MFKRILCFIVFSILCSPVSAKSSYEEFNEIFSKWTKNFNQKKLEASCDLFSKKLEADYRGFPTKSYHTICNGFNKIFKQTNMRYHYKYKLHKVYKSEDLAVARITWYLSVYKNKKLIEKTQDEGIDVFKKDAKNNWKIIQYLGFPK